MARAKLKDVGRDVNTVTVRRRQEATEIADKKLANSLSRAFDLSVKSKAIKEEYDEIKKFIIEIARKHVGDQQTVSFEYGKVACKVTFSKESEVPKANLALLTKMLGKSRIDDLLKKKESYKPENRLIQLASEDPEIAELIVIKDKAPSVNFSVKK